MKQNYLLLIITVFFIISSCKKENTEPSAGKYKQGGVFVVNEGNFSSANSSITYYYPETDSTTTQIFYRANAVPLGDVAQFMCFYNNKAFVSVNNSGTVYCFEPSTGNYVGSITNLISPREILVLDGTKAYISDFSSDNLIVFNPETYEVTGTVEVGKSTETMLFYNDKVYVSNWSSYNQTKPNNTIMIIDPSLDEVTDSIVVGIEPQSMVIDMENNLWVLCSGGYNNVEKPSLWKINLTDHSIIDKFTFDEQASSPEDLCKNKSGNTLYFRNTNVYSMPINATSLPETSLISVGNRTFYSLSISPSGEIYVSDALDYQRNGYVYRYNSDGQMITSFEAGIIPGQMVFYE